MNEILVWLSVFVFGIIILSKIPGLEHFVKPIIDLLFTGLKFGIENSANWFIWLFKLLLGSHIELFKHFTLSNDALDISAAVRKDDK